MNAGNDIKDLLSGFARANPEAMEELTTRTDWAALAKWEQQRRAAKLLALFDDATLSAIAAGQLDLTAACLDAMHNRAHA